MTAGHGRTQPIQPSHPPRVPRLARVGRGRLALGRLRVLRRLATAARDPLLPPALHRALRVRARPRPPVAGGPRHERRASGDPPALRRDRGRCGRALAAGRPSGGPLPREARRRARAVDRRSLGRRPHVPRERGPGPSPRRLLGGGGEARAGGRRRRLRVASLRGPRRRRHRRGALRGARVPDGARRTPPLARPRRARGRAADGDVGRDRDRCARLHGVQPASRRGRGARGAAGRVLPRRRDLLRDPLPPARLRDRRRDARALRPRRGGARRGRAARIRRRGGFRTEQAA